MCHTIDRYLIELFKLYTTVIVIFYVYLIVYLASERKLFSIVSRIVIIIFFYFLYPVKEKLSITRFLRNTGLIEYLFSDITAGNQCDAAL
jgi:hypothetical protein